MVNNFVVVFVAALYAVAAVFGLLDWACNESTFGSQTTVLRSHLLLLGLWLWLLLLFHVFPLSVHFLDNFNN